MGMRAWLLISALACGVCSAPASAGLILDVFASSAPNGFGSPSFDPYASNALHALEDGLSSFGGTREVTPEAYEQLGSTFVPGDAMVTSFNSWRGLANPGTNFGPAFADELGNRLHFGLHIYGDGTVQFRLEDLTFDIQTEDPANGLGFAGNFIGFDFNCTTRYGINWGADRARGGADDTSVCGTGSGTSLVDELVYVGVGNAYWPGAGDPSAGQAEIDAVAQYFYSEVAWIQGQYWIAGSDGQQYHGGDIVHLAQVPEPGSISLLLAGFVVLGAGMAAHQRRIRVVSTPPVRDCPLH